MDDLALDVAGAPCVGSYRDRSDLLALRSEDAIAN